MTAIMPVPLSDLLVNIIFILLAKRPVIETFDRLFFDFYGNIN